MINFRKLHRKSAPIIFLPLLLSALTGVAYRLGRTWFGISAEIADFFITLHEGRFLGKPLVTIYVLLVGLGLLGMIVTGLTMIKWQRQTPKSNPKRDWRWFHRLLAPSAFLPLFVSAITGIAYRLGRAWFGLSSQQASILLRIHQGSYLGNFKAVYVLLVGLSLLALLITGIQITRIFRKSRG